MYNGNVPNNISNVNSVSSGSVVMPPASGAPNQGGFLDKMKNSNIWVLVVTICAVLGLGLGIFSTIHTISVGQSLAGTGDSADSEGVDNTDTSCVLPQSSTEIEYLLMGTNGGKNQISVDTAGEVAFYTEGEDGTARSENIQTNVGDILQFAFANGLNSYSNLSEESENWAWVVEMGMTNGHICQAGGNQAAPAWFNSLVDLANSKK